MIFLTNVLSQVVEQFSSATKLDDKMEFWSCLECRVKSHHEWVFELRQHFTLSVRVIDLVLLIKLFFLQNFQSVQLVIVQFAYQNDFSKATNAQDFEHLEIVQRNALVGTEWIDLGNTKVIGRSVAKWRVELIGDCNSTWSRQVIGPGTGVCCRIDITTTAI